MVSSFDVYLVMQLDSIRFALAMCCVFGSTTLTLQWVNQSYGYTNHAFALVAIAGAGFALTPSSKTAAAMILVPAITSDQVVEPITAEAKELYALAKQALANVAKPVEPPAQIEKTESSK